MFRQVETCRFSINLKYFSYRFLKRVANGRRVMHLTRLLRDFVDE